MAECRTVFKIIIIIIIIITTTTIRIITTTVMIIVKVIIIIIIIIQGIYQAPTLLLKALSNTNRQYMRCLLPPCHPTPTT